MVKHQLFQSQIHKHINPTQDSIHHVITALTLTTGYASHFRILYKHTDHLAKENEMTFRETVHQAELKKSFSFKVKIF